MCRGSVRVCLRPTLILFGFIAATLLAYVGIQVMTNGFAIVTLSGAGKGVIDADAISFFLSMVMYIFLIIVIIQQSFKLVVDLPNRTLQWLGAQGQLGGNMDEAVQQMKQHGQSASGAAQGAFNKQEQNAREMTRQAAKKYGDPEDTKSTNVSGAASSGGGAPGGGGDAMTDAMRASQQGGGS